MRTCRVGMLALLCVGIALTHAYAQLPDSDSDSTFSLRYSFKSSALVSRLPDDPAWLPERHSTTGFWRFRLEPTLRVTEGTTFDIAFEQRLRVFTSASGLTGAGVLPRDAAAPFRIRRLDWLVSSLPHAEWRSEIDRAAMHVRLSSVDLTVGRQAIGWGRGVLFGAVDLFSPFTPLEADREWRRGVDAVRAEVKVASRVSFEAVGAFGDTMSRSAFVARLRGYAGRADMEIVGGRRARDLFGGVASSAALGRAEVHGELAAFRTPPVPGSLDFAVERSVIKAVAGGSYRFGVGSGLVVYVEYHYSGFGASSDGGLLAQRLDPVFQERFLRGDMQIVGRHAAALLASYDLSPEAVFSTEWLQSPVDGSGVIMPTTTLTLTDRWSIVLSGYLPYGRAPEGPMPKSQFGAAPLALFVQLRIYG